MIRRLYLPLRNLTSGEKLWGGTVAEWLGRRTCNPEVTGSSPALTTKLELFLGGP